MEIGTFFILALEHRNMSSASDPVKFVSDSDDCAAIIDDEAYNISPGEVVIHETDDQLYVITDGEYYVASYDENEWVVLDEDAPQFVVDELESRSIRFADADVRGFPIKLDVSYRSDDAIFDSSWQNEVLRPSSEVAQEIHGSIKEVGLTLEIQENGDIRAIGVSLWPNNSNVTLDL